MSWAELWCHGGIVDVFDVCLYWVLRKSGSKCADLRNDAKIYGRLAPFDLCVCVVDGCSYAGEYQWNSCF